MYPRIMFEKGSFLFGVCTGAKVIKIDTGWPRIIGVPHSSVGPGALPLADQRIHDTVSYISDKEHDETGFTHIIINVGVWRKRLVLCLIVLQNTALSTFCGLIF